MKGNPWFAKPNQNPSPDKSHFLARGRDRVAFLLMVQWNPPQPAELKSKGADIGDFLTFKQHSGIPLIFHFMFNSLAFLALCLPTDWTHTRCAGCVLECPGCFSDKKRNSCEVHTLDCINLLHHKTDVRNNEPRMVIFSNVKDYCLSIPLKSDHVKAFIASWSAQWRSFYIKNQDQGQTWWYKPAIPATLVVVTGRTKFEASPDKS
jgi:hypothetical protein